MCEFGTHTTIAMASAAPSSHAHTGRATHHADDDHDDHDHDDDDDDDDDDDGGAATTTTTTTTRTDPAGDASTSEEHRSRPGTPIYQYGKDESRDFIQVTDALRDAVVPATPCSIEVAVGALNGGMQRAAAAAQRLTEDEFHRVGAFICALMKIYTCYNFSRKAHDAKKSASRFQCVHRGTSSNIDPSKAHVREDQILHNGCSVQFVVTRNGVAFPSRAPTTGGVDKYRMHCVTCLPLSREQMEKRPSLYAALVSPSLFDEATQTGRVLQTADPSLLPHQVKRQLEAAFTSRNIPVPPKATLRAILKGAGAAMYGDERNSVTRVVEDLVADGTPHAVLYDPVFRSVVTAVVWRVATPSEMPLSTPISVAAHDVTFGVIDPSSGFDKTSLICSSSPGGESTILTGAMIVHEDTATFEFIVRFACETFPSLHNAIWFTDEDAGFIRALLTVVPEADQNLFVCAWHKAKNVQKRRALYKKSASSRADAPASGPDAPASGPDAQAPASATSRPARDSNPTHSHKRRATADPPGRRKRKASTSRAAASPAASQALVQAPEPRPTGGN